MHSPPFPRYLLPPRSKYSPQHHVLKHPQLPFLPQCQRPSFTPIQNNRQNYSSTFKVGFTIEMYYDARPYERQMRETSLIIRRIERQILNAQTFHVAFQLFLLYFN